MREDIRGVTTLMCIFGLALLAYGLLLAVTRNKNLLPARAQHSIRTADDVRLVGRITVVIGAVIAAASAVAFLVFG